MLIGLIESLSSIGGVFSIVEFRWCLRAIKLNSARMEITAGKVDDLSNRNRMFRCEMECLSTRV